MNESIVGGKYMSRFLYYVFFCTLAIYAVTFGICAFIFNHYNSDDDASVKASIVFKVVSVISAVVFLIFFVWMI